MARDCTGRNLDSGFIHVCTICKVIVGPGSLENPVDMDFCLKIHNTPQNEMIFVSGFWQLVFVTNPNYHQPHFLENRRPNTILSNTMWSFTPNPNGWIFTDIGANHGSMRAFPSSTMHYNPFGACIRPV